MRAAIVAAAGEAIEVVDDLDIDEPRAGEALIAVDACGVCGSDLSLLTGKMAHPMPMVLGHEACGRVVAGKPAGSAGAAASPPATTVAARMADGA